METNPTALISWAHRNTGWTDHEAESWISQVLQLSETLVSQGIDVELDLWNESNPAIDWTRWGPHQVEQNDFVLVVISRAWNERWAGTNAPTQGAGAVAEADALKGRFETNQDEFQKRTIVVLLPGADENDIPPGLRRLYRSHVKELNEGGVEDLLRVMYGAPRYEKPVHPGSRPAFLATADTAPASVPDPAKVATKRAELDAVTMTDENYATGDNEQKTAPILRPHVLFRKPSLPEPTELSNPTELTPAEKLSNQMDQAVWTQVFQDWDEETKLFKSIITEPTRKSVVRALELAFKSDLISARGPRVSIYDTKFMVRFLFPKDIQPTTDFCLGLETSIGEELAKIPWEIHADPVRVLSDLSRKVFDQADFEGAFGVYPSSIFSGLSDLLALASEERKGFGMGSRHAFTKIIEIVDNYWVVTEDRIFPKKSPWYTIDMNRIDEMDWKKHIQGKQWEDESGIERALAIGRKIFAQKIDGGKSGV